MGKLVTKFELVEVVSPEGWKERLIKDRPRNLSELLDNTVANFPDKEAFVCDDTRITYRQFATCVNNIAVALQEEYGNKKGDRVALLQPNSIEFAMSFFATVKLGAIAVPLNIWQVGEELTYQINDSGARLLIMDKEFWGVIEPVRAQLTGVEHIFAHGIEPPKGTVPFQKLRDRTADKVVKVDIGELDTAAILYTSGTTGRPKGAMQFHRGIIATGMFSSEYFDFDPHSAKILCPVPLFHTTALSSLLTGAVYSGTTLVLMRTFKASNALALIEKEGITVITAVITIYWLMINAPDFDRYRLSSLRKLCYGGSPAPADIVKQMREKLPNVAFHNGYGLTETHAFDTLLPSEDTIRKVESVGFVLPHMEARIVDDKGNDLPPNEIGELLLKGPKVIRAYWNKPQATKETVVDGWLHTGDLAKIDEEGYVYIVDRIKDMIIRGGENIYSIEVENVLYRNPKVLEAAVVGVPDEVFQEQVKAVVVLKPGQKATEEEIQEFCRAQLARYKVPKYVEFRDALPRNPGGKVVKGQLK